MATLIDQAPPVRPRDHLSGSPRAGFVDRWIYVFMAGWFIAITLIGFIPDSLMRIELIEAGKRPPFSPIVHVHAVLMGSFLLFLLSQTVLAATGRIHLHRRVGPIGGLLAVALIAAGFILVPTNYHMVWETAHYGSTPMAQGMRAFLPTLDDIMLLQLRIGFLFAILMAIGFRARSRNAGFHKRMMILAPAVALPAAFDRIKWIPTTFPESPLSPDLYVLLAVAPMFLWDVYRNRRVHEAYLVFLAVVLPFTILVHALWDRPWWHAMAPHVMGL